MKIKLAAIVVALTLAAGLAACGGGESSNANTSNKAATNSNATNANTSKASAPATMEKPEGTFKIAYDAAKARDIAAFKRTLSKEYMELLKGLADREKRSVDDIIVEKLTKNPMPENPETRNIEQQESDLIKMEFKDGTGKWVMVYLVKEGNDWKFAPGPGSNLLEDQAEGSGKEGTEKDIKDAKEKKGK